jgi:hypothetical protein
MKAFHVLPGCQSSRQARPLDECLQQHLRAHLGYPFSVAPAQVPVGHQVRMVMVERYELPAQQASTVKHGRLDKW